MKHLILLSTVFLSMLSCRQDCVKKGGHDSILWKNESERTLEYLFTEIHSPDTIIPIVYNPLTDRPKELLPHSSESRVASRPRVECYESLYSGGRTSWLYFFDYDSLVALSWDTVRITGRGILEKREINLEYLQTNNFGIYLPYVTKSATCIIQP